MATLLIVDDVAALAEQYAYDLERLGGHDTHIASGGQEALALLGSVAVDCMILDLEMPGMDGFEVLRRMRVDGYDTPVIVYTGTGDFERCVRAVRLGAFGFVDKSEPMERVAQEIENALRQRALQAEVASLRSRVEQESTLLGNSNAMSELRALLVRLGPVPSTVLILGESGVGKELVARELHTLGPGPTRPFVVVNSAALPEHLVESELFGHERGAFTGADRTRKGAFETASGGTLFLDEVGELPLAAQAKLLRVLENHALTRVGGNQEIQVDTRVVAATNRDLEKGVRDGSFREDLLYRLNPHVVRVPTLRERPEDVPVLVDHFLSVLSGRFGMSRPAIAPEVMEHLVAYGWPRNNVRELRNVVERLLIHSAGDRVELDHLSPEVRGDMGPSADGNEPRTFQERRAAAERQIILQALERNEGHVTRAATDLGLADHASLLKIMRRLGIQR